MYMRVMNVDEKTIVAVCDCNCINKVFEDSESGKILDLKAHGNFYKGEVTAPEKIRERLRDADSVNLVGEKAIEIGLEAGVIEQESVVEIGGIPHAQGYLIG
ncbi:DUF424 domain-containing protein [Candidatus Undinarchaeota archaeon]